MAGALGGYVYLQRKDKASVEASLGGQISDQKSSLEGLRSEVASPAFRLLPVHSHGLGD